MEINFKSNITLLMLLISSFQIYCDDLIELTVVDQEKQNVLIDLKDPLKGIIFDFTKKVDSKNNILKTENILLATLNRGEFIQIKGLDSRTLLFDGSLIIQFKTFPDLNNFANTNNIELITNLSDINSGIFKISNIQELELTINKIKLDQNIYSINLSTIDPSIQQQ